LYVLFFFFFFGHVFGALISFAAFPSRFGTRTGCVTSRGHRFWARHRRLQRARRFCFLSLIVSARDGNPTTAALQDGTVVIWTQELAKSQQWVCAQGSAGTICSLNTCVGCQGAQHVRGRRVARQLVCHRHHPSRVHGRQQGSRCTRLQHTVAQAGVCVLCRCRCGRKGWLATGAA
jgi:hypothetical protein